jgi:hypothetical protein
MGRHEVNNSDCARIGYKVGFKDEGVLTVAPPNLNDGNCRRDGPVSILGVSNERSKASIGIEGWQAQPVN